MARDPQDNAWQARVFRRFHEVGGKKAFATTQDAVGIEKSTVYAWMGNALNIPAFALGRLWDAYRDEKLISDLIGPTEHPFIFSRAPAAGVVATEPQMIAFAEKAGAALTEAARAFADRKWTDDERRQVRARLQDLAREVQTFLAVLGDEQ